jgi:hypothetical protein
MTPHAALYEFDSKGVTRGAVATVQQEIQTIDSRTNGFQSGRSQRYELTFVLSSVPVPATRGVRCEPVTWLTCFYFGARGVLVP